MNVKEQREGHSFLLTSDGDSSTNSRVCLKRPHSLWKAPDSMPCATELQIENTINPLSIDKDFQFKKNPWVKDFLGKKNLAQGQEISYVISGSCSHLTKLYVTCKCHFFHGAEGGFPLVLVLGG